MNITVEKVNLNNITREDAQELKSELFKMFGDDNLVFKQHEFPKLYELKKLLQGCFDEMHSGVHWIERKEK